MEGKTGMYDVAEICRFHGVEAAVLCPGSRCAPLTLAFTRTEGIRCLSVVDERSAAFIALGMAETTGKPVVLVCTSGTAVLNFGPALAEAFYRRVPLVVLTADRPQRLVGQQDGQTMEQPGVYTNFIRAAYRLDGDIATDAELAFLHRTVNAALIQAQGAAPGPVHINISFEEPLYRLAEQASPARCIRLLKTPAGIRSLLRSVPHSRWMVLVGSRKKSAVENELLQRLGGSVPVLSEAVSNLWGEHTVPNANEVMRTALPAEKESLAPEVLVTVGEGIVSKQLKIFLRAHKPKFHLHIDPAGELIDTYQSLTHVLAVPPSEAFEAIAEHTATVADAAFLAGWKQSSQSTAGRVDALVAGMDFGDMRAMDFIARHIPPGVIVHVANSMPVRYLNLFSSLLPADTEVFCNRGTSGIDGSISTAVGNGAGSGKPVWVITGDLSFQYDGNALWNGLVSADMRILIVNNSGGGIFRLIEGPSSVPELTERFEVRTQSSARHKAAQYGLDYVAAASAPELEAAWTSFAAPGANARILEIYTDPLVNETVFKSFQQKLSITI